MILTAHQHSENKHTAIFPEAVCLLLNGTLALFRLLTNDAYKNTKNKQAYRHLTEYSELLDAKQRDQLVSDEQPSRQSVPQDLLSVPPREFAKL